MRRKYFTVPLVLLAVIGIISLANSSESSGEKSQKIVTADAPSSITSIDSFDEIQAELAKADSDTLVIFDVDDVLITYDDMVLRPCGARFRPASWKDIDPKEIPYLISIMLDEGKIILVDSSAPQLVNKLGDRGVKTIALTAARTGKFGVIENMEDWRLKVLKQFNIDFSGSFPKTQVIYFGDAAKKEKDYSLFKDGILFLGDEETSKGSLLVQFLDKIQWKPKKIIFIDDKMSQITSVETALNEAKIPFQGYQYKGEEKLPGELDEQVAEVQFSILRKDHKWLSDSEAKKEEKGMPVPNQ